jgi:hypothetical protein
MNNYYNFTYFCVPGLAMNGGDIGGKTTHSSFQEALTVVKQRIGNDPAKCGSVDKI